MTVASQSGDLNGSRLEDYLMTHSPADPLTGLTVKPNGGPRLSLASWAAPPNSLRQHE
jgi:hypothetical protein